MCRVVALTRGDVVLMEVKIRRRADALQERIHGWRIGIDGGKDTKTRQRLASGGVRMASWY